MKLIIDISEEVKQVFDNAESNDLKDGFYDIGGVIGKAISNGTPLAKHDEEVIKETVASVWGKPPYNDVLDKIRAEIKQVAEEEIKHDKMWAKGLKYALKIIDKSSESIRQKCDNDHDCEHCDWVECPLESEE